MSRQRKRVPKKPRDLVVLGMILTRKGGPMRLREEKRVEPIDFELEIDDECNNDDEDGTV